MKAARIFFILAVASTPALGQQHNASVPFRWASGFAQGTVEAIIRSPDDSYIAFACPAGQMTVYPSISVQVRGRSPRGFGTLQLVVDDRNFPVGLRDGYGRGDGRSFEAAIVNAAEALVMSRRTSFIAEIPEIGWRQTFSLLNVRDALGQSGRTIVHGCWRP